VTRAVLAALESGSFAQIIADAAQSDEMQAAMTEYQEMRAPLGGLPADFYTEPNRYARGELLKRICRLANRSKTCGRALTNRPNAI